MRRSSGSIQDRTELVLALYEARRMAEKNLSEAPELLRDHARQKMGTA
jgi:hypothetical protein